MKDTIADRLVFGTAGLTALPSYYSAKNLLREAFNCEIKHFDTAPIYGRGYAEYILGKFLKEMNETCIVTTKFGLQFKMHHFMHPILAMPLNYAKKKLSNSPSSNTAVQPQNIQVPYRKIDIQQVKDSFYGSLKRLKRDRIDFYLLHEGLPSFLEDEALSFLQKKRDEGIIGKLGIGTNAYILTNATAEDFTLFDVLQYEAGVHHEVLIKKHPEKIHFLHSCFKSRYKENITHGQHPNPVNYWANINKKGKVLFFTKRKALIKENTSSL